jgi:nucleoid-associated protein YgaU
MKIFLNKAAGGCLLFAGLSVILSSCGERQQDEGNSPSAPYHIGMGKAYYQLGEYEKAIEMYQKAIELNSRQADAYLQLAIIYDDNLKDEEQAINYYRCFLNLAPDSERAERVKNWIAQCQERQKKMPPPAGEEEISTAYVPPPVPGSSPPFQEKPPGDVPPRLAGEEGEKILSYTIRQGDTLAGIAQKIYGDRTSWRRIYQANRDSLSTPDVLQPGQVLTIPSKN